MVFKIIVIAIIQDSIYVIYFFLMMLTHDLYYQEGGSNYNVSSRVQYEMVILVWVFVFQSMINSSLQLPSWENKCFFQCGYTIHSLITSIYWGKWMKIEFPMLGKQKDMEIRQESKKKRNQINWNERMNQSLVHTPFWDCVLFQLQYENCSW